MLSESYVTSWTGDAARPISQPMAMASPEYHPSNPKLAKLWRIREPNPSGVEVTEDNALTYAAVWRCVTLISQTVAKTPLFVYKNSRDGSRERATDHPAYRLLRRRSQSIRRMTSYDWKRLMQAHVLLWGNAYSWIIRNSAGEPKELVPLMPDRTAPVITDTGRLMYYTHIREPNGQYKLQKLFPSSVLHIHGIGFDGLVGYPVIEYAAQSMGLGMAARTMGSRYFSRGSIASGILMVPEGLDEEQEKRFVESFERAHTGLGNSHRLIVLEGNGADFKQLTIPNEQAQFLETRKYQDTVEIGLWFGVPPHRLGGDVSTSYGSLEQENQAFLDDGVDPWLCNWEENCAMQLLTEEEQENESHTIEFLREALKRVALKEQTESMVMELNNGGLTLNEYLRMKNRPSAGEDGDRYRIPTNITFIDKLDEPPAPNPLMPPNEDNEDDGEDEDTPEPEEQEEPAEENTEAKQRSKRILADALRRSLYSQQKSLTRKSKRSETLPTWDDIRNSVAITITDELQLYAVVGNITNQTFADDLVREGVSLLEDGVNLDAVDVSESLLGFIEGSVKC